MTVNRQAIHSFDLYGRDDEKKVVVPVFVTKNNAYILNDYKKGNYKDLCQHTVMFNSDGL